jgi:hypothetical protein
VICLFDSQARHCRQRRGWPMPIALSTLGSVRYNRWHLGTASNAVTDTA